MYKKQFTLVELLVVITIIAILASMLFPSFAKMQRRGLQSNSMNQCRNMMVDLATYFTDSRRRLLPDLNDPLGNGYGLEEGFICPAGGGTGRDTADVNTADYGYRSSVGDSQGTTTNNYTINDSEVQAFNSVALGNGNSVTGDVRFIEINNEQSAILTTYERFSYTLNLKPLAYGDGHGSMSGEDN